MEEVWRGVTYLFVRHRYLSTYLGMYPEGVWADSKLPRYLMTLEYTTISLPYDDRKNNNFSSLAAYSSITALQA